MIGINILSFFALVAFSVSLVSAGCDYNVTSVSQLTTIFNNDQTGWTSVPTLCFAAGTYTLLNPLAISASQNWVGPQQGVDPTCGRLINPPCERYTSASTANATVEAVFNFVSPHSGGVQSYLTPNLNFTLDGFSTSGGFYNFFISQDTGFGLSLTVKNSYIYDLIISADYITLDRCLLGWYSWTYQYVTSDALSVTVTNSFFYRAGLGSFGAMTVIGNTFAFVGTTASPTGPSHFENNAFYTFFNGEVIYDEFGQTSLKNNLFWGSTLAYESFVKNTINFDSNCFIDNLLDIIYFTQDINTTNAVFNNNYFGDPNGPKIVYESPSFTTIGNKFGASIEVVKYLDFNFTYSPKHLDFVAPNVCPHPPFSLAVKPNNIKLGETVNITISFELHPLFIGAGITPSMFDGVTLELMLDYGDLSEANYYYLPAFPGNNFQTTWNPSNQSSLSVLYTFQPNDVQVNSLGEVLSPPNYYVYYSVQQLSSSSPLYPSYSTSARAPLTITPKVPLECYNMSLSINKNVTAGPRKYNFQQLGCSASYWAIVSVNTTNLFSYVNFRSLQIVTNTSGVRLAHYQVQFSNGDLAGSFHNVVTKINIVNHNPVINSANFIWTYPRTQLTFPTWNLLTNCSDSDGDNVTVVQIQRTQARTDATVVQLDNFTLYFVTEKAVVSVLPTGHITLTAPSNSNPVTAGAPLALFWKQDISFQFQITDGDVVDQYAWGIANINYVISD